MWVWHERGLGKTAEQQDKLAHESCLFYLQILAQKLLTVTGLLLCFSTSSEYATELLKN